MKTWQMSGRGSAAKDLGVEFLTLYSSWCPFFSVDVLSAGGWLKAKGEKVKAILEGTLISFCQPWDSWCLLYIYIHIKKFKNKFHSQFLFIHINTAIYHYRIPELSEHVKTRCKPRVASILNVNSLWHERSYHVSFLWAKSVPFKSIFILKRVKIWSFHSEAAVSGRNAERWSNYRLRCISKEKDED